MLRRRVHQQRLPPLREETGGTPCSPKRRGGRYAPPAVPAVQHQQSSAQDPLACSASAGSRSGGGRPTPLDGPCVAIRHAGPQEFSPTLKYQASVEDSQERFILVRSSERKRCLLRRIFLNSVTQKISDHRGPVRPACASNCRQALQMLRMVGRWSQRLGRRSAASAASEVYDYIGTCKTGSQDWQVFRCAGGGAVADASRVLLSWGRSLTSPARGRWGQLARSSARSPAIEACARGVGLRG
jgi:hypothetical protein